jgi:HTH-type transcriptional regulator/antitoxin HigA
MDIKPIKTDTDYRAALKEVETLMAAKPNTPKGEKLDVLVTLVELTSTNITLSTSPIPLKPLNLK